MDITNKIDAVTKIGEDRLSNPVQKAPKSVKIELTARCNLACKFCAVRTRKKINKLDMDFDLFKRITTEMKEAGVEEIGLFYLGESFMVPGLLLDACEWVKKELQFDWVFLTSNAVNANGYVVDELMRLGLDSLKWSVNSYDEHQFKYMTGGSKHFFDNTIFNIQNSHRIRREYRYKTMLSASSILYEKKQHEMMQKFLDENISKYVDKHYWLPMYNMAMYIKKIQDELGYTPTVGNMGRIDENTMLPNRPPLPCWAAFTEGHVRVDGGLSACCFGSDDKFDMGKLNGKNFMEQWNSKKFQELRKAQIMTLEHGPKALIGTPCNVCVAYEV